MVQNPPVGIGKKCLTPLARTYLIELVGAKPVQEFGSLAAGNFNLSDTWRPEKPNSPAKGPILGYPVAKIDRYRSPRGIVKNTPLVTKNVHDFVRCFHR